MRPGRPNFQGKGFAASIDRKSMAIKMAKDMEKVLEQEKFVIKGSYVVIEANGLGLALAFSFSEETKQSLLHKSGHAVFLQLIEEDTRSTMINVWNEAVRRRQKYTDELEKFMS